MKKYIVFILSLFLSLQLNAQVSVKKYIVISEVMYDSPLNEQIAQGIPYSNGEYIELYNLENTAVDLTGWKLTGGGKTEIYQFPANTIINPRSTLIVAYQYKDSGFLLNDLYSYDGYEMTTILYQRKIILSNSGETVSVVDNVGNVVDYITYDGTSNKTKPNRLSATNEDGTAGDHCKSLHRSLVLFDETNNIIFDPTHWKTELGNLFEVQIESPIDLPSQNKNYVLETTYTSSQSGRSCITYYDGLGRPCQTIDIAASPVNSQNIVSFVEYDCMGRNDSIVYLPYVTKSQSITFRQNPLNEQTNFYQNIYAYDNKEYDRNYPFAAKEYDKSNMGLVMKQGSSGLMYQLNSHPKEYEYGFNGPWGEVKKYSVTESGTLNYKGSYPEKSLTTKITKQPVTDFEKSILIEYYDANENLIAREQHISMQDRRITYYIYDDLGHLRYVLPPSANIQATTSPDQLPEDCFYYEYDEYNHICKQYIPGASYTLFLYDKRGRLVMKQNGEQRKNRQWTFTKYDIFDRPIMEGIYSGGTYETHKAALANQTNFGEEIDRAAYNYTNQCYPNIDNANILNITYYDDYDWIPDGEDEDRYNYRSEQALGNSVNYKIKGKVSARTVKILDPAITQQKWLTTLSYYDEKYRVIQTVGDLYPEGIEIVSNKYDYAGNITEVLVRQEFPTSIHEYRKWMNYDNHGRLLSIDQEITGDTVNGRVTIAHYTYDELGRSIEKKLHNAYETCSYKYDIEGQNTSGKSSLFDYEICMISPNGNFTSRYDHKPALFVWNRHDSDNSSGYKYDYDLTGQLKTAAYIQRAQNDENWGESSAFNERDIEYDKNGNILQMKRTDSTGNRLHYLAYIYRGNQLISFSCNDQVYEGYTYDASGNLTYDPYSNIHIEYNELNLPSRIFDDNKEVRYIYSADGQKLKTIADGSFTYYRSTMIYGGSPGSGEQLLYILHPEGMAVNENGTFAYKYNLTDYMGNVRTYAVADRSSETLLEEQVLDYYPFGLAHSYNNLHKNRYLFSGKELQDASLGRHGFLELYDFGARYYNPMSGRWFNPDPALQTVNPYLFCGNTPMVYIDQDGEFFFTILNAIKDFFHGLFTWNWSSENWHSTVMAFKIDMGWFQGNFGQILSRFTWELPQTLFGHLGSQTENLFEGVKSVSYYGGATAVETYSAKWGGFTLGSFIIGHRGLHADPNNSLFQHEYGHYLQSRASGPLYLGKYAIPSFYDTMFGRGNHKYHSVEQDANARAIKYFEKRIPGFADRRNKGINEGWDHYKYPIVGYDVQGGFYSARSQAALDRAHIPAFESPLDAFVAVLSLNPVTSFGTGAIYQTPYNTRKNNNAYINENKCSIITR